MTKLEIMAIFSAMLKANQKKIRNSKKKIALEIIFLSLPELTRVIFQKFI